ncbi:CHASE2 domain-containing protein [Ekhidna sp.]|uniref:CHASE2 domain-containing protein n=1 Tax=Ekhidna sp. TaxID=2608089 RepID=UPI003CCB7473
MRKKVLIALIILIAVAGIFFVVTFNQMTDEVETYAPIKEGKEDRIVFFDIGDGDREYLAQLIDSIQKCNPKVLAIDIFFEDLKDARKDSLLMASLNSSNIVLATKHDGYRTTNVHENFLEQVDAYGYAQSKMRGRYTSDAVYFTKGKDNHFSVEIAKMYDPELNMDYINERRDQETDIKFTRLEHQFKIYPFKDFDFNCTEIEGKIAYMGPFSNNEDLHVTKARYHEKSKKFEGVKNEPDMHGSIVVVNQVLMILDQIE